MEGPAYPVSSGAEVVSTGPCVQTAPGHSASGASITPGMQAGPVSPGGSKGQTAPGDPNVPSDLRETLKLHLKEIDK